MPVIVLAQGPDSPYSNLDAICKAEPIPPGFVTVGEMESPECEASNPPAKNAWLIDRVHDNIVTCTSPDYAHGFPPAIAYGVCTGVLAPECPSRLDGSPNGYRLNFGNSCTGPNYISECTLVRDRKGAKEDDEVQYWVVGAVENHADCAGKRKCVSNRCWDTPDKVTYRIEIKKGETVPFCTRWNGWPIFRMMNHGKVRTGIPKYLVIRQFYTELCPQVETIGAIMCMRRCVERPGSNLNAIVVQRLTKEEWEGKVVFMCDSSVFIQLAFPAFDAPEDRRYANMNILEVFHDDRCGISQGEDNALKVKYID